MWRIEQTSLGRIVVPDGLPDRTVVFCTTADLEGRLTEMAIDGLATLLRERFGFEGSIASCAQVHGAAVATAARGTDRWNETPACDALVSVDDGVALAIKVADCLPVGLFDSESGRVASVHAGWRGAAARVVPAALGTMRALHGTQASSLCAWLGPSIRGCCFEVGEEVVEALGAAYGDVSPWVDRSRGANPRVDLSGLTVRLLEEAGVPRAAIDDSGVCTRCEGSIFHSYRRDGARSGRNLMVIAHA